MEAQDNALAAILQLVKRDTVTNLEKLRSMFMMIAQMQRKDKGLSFSQLLIGALVENNQSPLLAQYLVTFGQHKKDDIAQKLFGEMSPEEYAAQKNHAAITDPELKRLIEQTVRQNLGKVNKASTSNTSTPAPMATVQLPLLEALTRYQSVNDQVITNIPLELRGRKDLAPGTVKNWLYDYRDQLGSGEHAAMERGSYLFNSKNTKRLDTTNRHRLALILKSLDEGSELTVDTDNNKIVLDTPPPTPPHPHVQQPVKEHRRVQAPSVQTRSAQPAVAPPRPQLNHAQPVAMKPSQQQIQPSAQKAHRAFRDMHHAQSATAQPPQKAHTPKQAQRTTQATPQSPPQQDIAFSSKQKMSTEQMKRNVRGAMQKEGVPQQRKASPQPKQKQKPIQQSRPQPAPKKVSAQYPAQQTGQPAKKPRRSPFQMKPIE